MNGRFRMYARKEIQLVKCDCKPLSQINSFFWHQVIKKYIPICERDVACKWLDHHNRIIGNIFMATVIRVISAYLEYSKTS